MAKKNDTPKSKPKIPKKRNLHEKALIQQGNSGGGFHHQRQYNYEKGHSRHRKHKPSGHLPDPSDWE